jgi:hypothetical protein
MNSIGPYTAQHAQSYAESTLADLRQGPYAFE